MKISGQREHPGELWDTHPESSPFEPRRMASPFEPRRMAEAVLRAALLVCLS